VVRYIITTSTNLRILVLQGPVGLRFEYQELYDEVLVMLVTIMVTLYCYNKDN
jgi:hypothetical protein